MAVMTNMGMKGHVQFRKARNKQTSQINYVNYIGIMGRDER